MARKHVSAMFVVALAFMATSVVAMQPSFDTSSMLNKFRFLNKKSSNNKNPPDDGSLTHVQLRVSELKLHGWGQNSGLKVVISTKTGTLADFEPGWPQQNFDDWGWEVLHNNKKSEKFDKKSGNSVDMEYKFDDAVQYLRFEILNKKGYVGYCQATLDDIVTSNYGKLKMPIRNPKVNQVIGFLTAQSNKYHGPVYAKFAVNATFSTKAFENDKGVYFTISRNHVLLYKSKTKSVNNGNDGSGPFALFEVRVPVAALSNTNPAQELEVQMWSEAQVLLGEAYVKRAELESEGAWPKRMTPAGTLQVRDWNTFAVRLPKNGLTYERPLTLRQKVRMWVEARLKSVREKGRKWYRPSHETADEGFHI